MYFNAIYLIFQTPDNYDLPSGKKIIKSRYFVYLGRSAGGTTFGGRPGGGLAVRPALSP